MSTHTDPQVIMLNGKPAFAVLPWDDYAKLAEYRDKAQHDVWFPQSVVEANAVREEGLIKAWREYFGLTQKELADRAGIKQPSLARLEGGKSTPRTSTLKKLAEAMGLAIEQLIE
ncbi:MAG: helix-turn-helix domain-containing protein [Pseudomonadota bacterium]